jgi:hypothetical protein
MTDYTPNVTDLALYFSDDNGDLAGRWVPSAVYTTTSLEAQPAWGRADLMEQPVDGGVFYVVNLTKLLGPGSPINAKPKPAPAPPTPAAKDLVVVAPDSTGKTAGIAYLVPRAVYTNTNQCPPIAGDAAATIIGMATNQGVILANIPKASNISGWTCYLLSLVSLRSGALPGLDANDKTHYFAELAHKLNITKLDRKPYPPTGK